MPKHGVQDIEDLEVKIGFVLRVLGQSVLRERMEQLGVSLTGATLSAWRLGKNRPTSNKLRLFCALARLELADFYEDMHGFQQAFCRRNQISERDAALFVQSMERRQAPTLPVLSLANRSLAATQRLYAKLRGTFICYNATLDAMHTVSKTLICVEQERHPMLRIRALALRAGSEVRYTGWIFPARNNIQVILEAEHEDFTDFACMKMFNPSGMVHDVDFLYGVLLATAEDVISYPAASRVFWERFSQSTRLDEGREALESPVPPYCERLLYHPPGGEDQGFLLTSPSLSRAEFERMKQENS